MSLYEHVPHPHVAARKQEGPTRVNEQRFAGKGRIGRLNARIGLHVTIVVGTMWCAYLFTLLALVSLPSALKTHDKIIIVGQNVQAKAADKRAEDTYKDAEAVLHEALEIQRHLAAQDAVLTKLSTAAHGGTA